MRHGSHVLVASLLFAVACSKSSDDASPSAPPQQGAPRPVRASALGTTTGAPEPHGSAATAAEAPDDERGEFGSQVDAAEFDAAIAALPPTATGELSSPLPSRALLTNLPAVATQGTAKHRGAPGSCEAQSFGYGLGSYTAARAPDGHALWNPAEPQNQASAAFLYAWEHKKQGKACPKGSGALGYLGRLVSLGAPSAAEVPYKPECPYLDGATYLDGHYGDESRFRIGGFATFHLSPAALPLVKEMLAAGHAVAFSGPVLKGYGNPTLEDGVFYGKDTVPASGHGQLVVGYDDDRGKPGKKGAFLVQNSFGAEWPEAAPGGRMWIAYDALLGTQKLAAVAYPRDAWAASGATLAGKAGAPPAWIPRVLQWKASDTRTHLVLFHHFGEPVAIRTITLRDPSGRAATAKLEQYLQAGYTHLRRDDGKAFAPGKWEVTIDAATVSGDAVTYTGAITVPAAAGRAAGPLEGAIAGPTGAAATLR